MPRYEIDENTDVSELESRVAKERGTMRTMAQERELDEPEDELDEDDDVDLAEENDSAGDTTDENPVDEDDVEIEVVDDTPEEDRGRKPVKGDIEDPTPEELEQYSRKTKKRIRELTLARHDERRRADALAREKAELERYARTLTERTKEMEKYISMGQTAYIEKAKQLAALAANSAKAQLRAAYDEGDSEKIAAAQEALTQAQLQMQEANNFRAAPLQNEPTHAYTTQEQAVQRAPQQPEQPQVDETTQKWVERNPWFQSDQLMTDYAMETHARLVSEHGPAYVRNPNYFKRIDAAMRKAFPDRFVDEVDDDEIDDQPVTKKTAPARKRPSTVVAPAQRASSPKKIRLTQTQLNIAKELGISPQDYAKQLAALEKDNG